MIDTSRRCGLPLPWRDDKPRARGRTMVLDPGLPTGAFEDLIESHGDLIDWVKFGWGTGLVTKDIKIKIDVCRSAGVEPYFGGTLFEVCAAHARLDEWRRWCRGTGVRTVEISNGTVALSAARKAEYVRAFAPEFTVLSEVGFKDPDRSRALPVADWLAAIHADLEAGASLVTLESRQSGTSGIAAADGTPRGDLIAAVTASGVDLDRLLFEAPTTALQLHLLRTVGPQVNLGNVAPADVVGLETLRLGLRSDTLVDPLAVGR